MVYYRLYFLNASGHIARFHAFEASDDEAAIAEAARMHSASMELWCERRRVKQWGAPGRAENGREVVSAD